MCAGCKQLQAVTVNPLFSCGKNNIDGGERAKMSVPQTSLQICFLSLILFFSGAESNFFGFSQHQGTVGREREQANPNVPNSSPYDIWLAVDDGSQIVCTFVSVCVYSSSSQNVKSQSSDGDDSDLLAAATEEGCKLTF